MTMNTLEILDTFPAFLDFWDKCRDFPLDAQIDRWAGDYLAPWPDLLAKQIEDYGAQNIDWRAIAREKIFPELHGRLPAMRLAHENLLVMGESVFDRAVLTLGVYLEGMFVIHVGIGCGAGWVTRFLGTPAILFGLENIAESGWSGRDAISGLIAHELGHLAHHAWRDQHGREMGSGPWWQLYEEGFAQYCESLIMAGRAWHQVESDPDWLAWCQRNRGWLAAEFLRMADGGELINPFFGSWYDLRDRKETGYFLGYEAVQHLATIAWLEEIAVLEDAESVLRPILEEWTGSSW